MSFGRRKFWHLKGEKGNELYSLHPVESLRDKLIFRVEEAPYRKGENSRRYFLLFDNVYEYLIYFKENQRFASRMTLHELCSANLPRKLCFDIDVEIIPGQTFCPICFQQQMLDALQAMLPGFEKENLSVFSSHSPGAQSYLKLMTKKHKLGTCSKETFPISGDLAGGDLAGGDLAGGDLAGGEEEKISYHVVVQKFSVFNCKEAKRYFETFCEHYKGDLTVFDHGIYEAEHSLRALGWKKLGTDRRKIVDQQINCTPMEDLRKSISLGLVTNTVGCKLLPVLEREIQVYDSVELDSEDVQAALALFSDRDSFEYKEYKDGIIILSRVRSSMCLRCERVHDGNNAFLRITSEGDVLFGCYRGKALHIGNIHLNSPPTPEEAKRSKGKREERSQAKRGVLFTRRAKEKDLSVLPEIAKEERKESPSPTEPSGKRRTVQRGTRPRDIFGNVIS